MNGERTILVLFIVLVSTVSVYADMMPVPAANLDRSKPAYTPCDQTNLQYTGLPGLFNYPGISDQDLWHAGLLPGQTADTRQIPELQNIRSLTEGPGSFALCLYALIGLGLCQAAPWVKKLSFGFIPEWYHNGGPFQIGHSHAVTPETLYPMPACCFVQPIHMVESHIPKYNPGTIMSLWRKSQFTLDVIASRGPPWRS
jgi:hypothetical protein